MRLFQAGLIACLPLFCSPAASAEDELLFAWEFDARGDAEGWFNTHSIAPLEVRDGLLHVKCTGFDPYMHSSRGHSFEIEGSPFQYIQIRCRTKLSQTAEFFWANALEGRDQGFVAGEERHFGMVADGEFHTYHVFPLWEGKVTRIRFDPRDDDELQIDWIRIYQQPRQMPGGPLRVWDFETADDAQGCIPVRDLDLVEVVDGVARARTIAEAPTLLLPPTEIAAGEFPFVSLRLSSSEPATCRLMWNTDGKVNFSARNSVAFEVEGDGRMRLHNIRCADQPWWQETIGRLQLVFECPVGTQLEFDDIRAAELPQGPAELRVVSFGASPTVGIAGEPMSVTLTVENAGGEPLPLAACTLTVPAPLSVAGAAERPIGRLEAGARADLEWNVRAPEGFSGEREASIGFRGIEVAGRSVVLRAYRVSVHDADGRGQFAVAGEDVCHAGNARVQVAIPRTEGAAPPVFLYMRERERWVTVARATHVAELFVPSAEGDPKPVPLALTDARAVEGRTLQLTLKARGAPGTVRVEFTPERNRPEIEVTATGSGLKGFVRFSGPMWLVGDGTFGGELHEGLLPGLEYLVSGERSSSSLDIAPPKHLRYASHPNRITVPTMAIEHGGQVVGVRWDPHQKWDGEHTRPTALFASPNFLEAPNSHLVGLFLPSIPDFVEENGLHAERPCPAREVSLTQTVFAQEGDVLVASDHFFGQRRVPPLPERVRSDEESLALSMRAFEEVLWSEDAQGWSGVKGWAAGDKRGTPLHMLLTAELLPDHPQAPAWAEKAERIGGPAHGWPLAFHLGGVLPALHGLRGGAYQSMASQQEDGGWVFRPSEKTAVLGTEGDVAVGLCANHAHAMLHYALVSGDSAVAEAGLKALEYMDRFRIPRASQVWEVPVHTPDILASARGCDAYLMGYRLTGETRYLRRAVYWARTGLPFVYCWEAPEIDPGMLYGSIPVFGATFFTGSWFGRLVQWNGLAYASSLYRLAEFDDSMPWRHIAEGLVVSGFNQQQTKEGFQGLYPDSYSMIDNGISWGLMLGPGGMLQTMLPLMGRDGGAETALVEIPGGTARITAPVRIAKAEAASADSLRVTIDYSARPGRAFHCAVAGIRKPTEVLKGDSRLEEAGDLAKAAEGWQFDESTGYLIVKVIDAGPTELAISGVAAARFAAGPLRWEFTEDGNASGWVPEHGLSPAVVEGGVFRTQVTGGDPFIVGPPVTINAERLRRLRVRLKAGEGASGQVFWAVRGGGFSPDRQLGFPVTAAGFETYTIDMSQSAAWTGIVTQLRLDIDSPVDNEVQIELIEVVE